MSDIQSIAVGPRDRSIKVTGELKYETELAWLIYNNNGESIWLPKSQVAYDGHMTFTVPVWLANNKGIGDSGSAESKIIAQKDVAAVAAVAERQALTWSAEQDKALKAITKWRRSSRKEQVFRLFGYAGTGKTTLAQYLADDDRVIFAAYTGKAAHVMRRKGCTGASTIHRLIYFPQIFWICRQHPGVEEAVEGRCSACGRDLTPKKQPKFVINPDSSLQRASLLVVDEVSMVDAKLGRDLLSFGTPILVIGDPAQLPPIEGRGFFTDAEPDVMLTEIHRQAKNDPIIHLSMLAREGKTLACGGYGESKVVSTISHGNIAGADQILVGLNRTRRSLNARRRRQLGFKSQLPVRGDKLVCLKNNHDIGLLNGSLWDVRKVIGGDIDGEIILQIEDEENILKVVTHTAFFDGSKELPTGYDEFDYGYALTVHKAQGSQWDNVVLLDQSGFFKENYSKWLYTGITRAAERITIVTE